MDFHGYPVGEIDNGWVRIGYLRHGSMRLVRLFYKDHAANLFVEIPTEGWQTPLGFYRLMGGHRLWVAPECVELTYLVEPEDISEEVLPHGLRLTQAVDRHSYLQRILEITFTEGRAGFTLKHTLVNKGEQAVTIAAWAISQFPLGGIAALPQPSTWADVSGLLPNRSLALWPYTRLSDPRFRWLDRYLMINAHKIDQPCKIGYSGVEGGWGVYWYDGILIHKCVTLQPGRPYPDNSNLEIYIDHRFLELETLSPLMQLQPGEPVIHEEHWNLEELPYEKDEQILAEYLDGKQEMKP